MATLIDSNVIIDVLTEDPVWFDWSSNALADAADQGHLLINQVVYAEVSVRFTRVEEIEDVLSDFTRESLPWTAGFLAGKAHASHLRRGGSRRTVLPDFLIAAHAAIASHTLVTRDAARVRTYFPKVAVVAP